VDEGTLKTYSADGICIPESGCDFSTVTETVDCAAAMGPSFVCLQGACVDPCAGQICSSPPAAECDGNSVVTYAGTGFCSSGLCTYAITSSTDCGADVCSTATGPASCVDASLAGVQLSGYRIQLLQNGEAPENVKFEVELSGDYSHGSYIVVVRDATITSWPLMFKPALGGAAVANIVELYDTEDSWQFNSIDDPVRILDATGQIVDMGVGVKDGINRRQADSGWLEVEGATTAGAVGAPDAVAGVAGPLYIFEIGEACTECHLFEYQGNYAMIYVP
jgi:hypothetical protein